MDELKKQIENLWYEVTQLKGRLLKYRFSGSQGLTENTTLKSGFLRSGNYSSASSGWKLTPTSAEFNVGTAMKSLDIPDTTTANSFHVDTAGNAWWGATTFAAAIASVSKLGAGIFSNITASNIITFQTTVATSGGDYTSISAAVTAGKTRIFVRNGDYTETTAITLLANTIIVGESKRGVEITFTGSGKFTCGSGATGIILRNLSIVGGQIDFDAISSNTQTTTLDGIYTSTLTRVAVYNNATIINCSFFEITTFDLTGTITVIGNYISTQTENFTGINAIACNGIIANNWIVFCRGVNQNTVNYYT